MPVETCYANLLGSTDKKYVRTVVNRVYRSLTDIYKFLERAKYFQEQNIQEIKWSVWKDRDQEVIENLMDNIPPEYRNQGAWVILKESENEEEARLIERFLQERNVFDNENCFIANKIRVLHSNEDFGVLLLEKIPKTEVIYRKPYPYVIERQLEALRKLQNSPHISQRAIIKLLELKEIVEWESFEPETIKRWFLLTKNEILGIEKQREFVKKALATPDFALLEGPPGSGKTMCICETILQAIIRNKRVLLCASTHVAVDNVLERLKDRDEVIAVRIGNEKRVSKEVIDFCLHKRSATEKRRLIQKLRSIPLQNRLESQKYLLSVLEDKMGKVISERIILDSSNLVCGTTIGILQHPQIKQIGSENKPLFDILIIDEASKTTFYEFLVPALLAKKWILVGDPKQLSPYIDEKDVEVNVATLMGKEDQEVCFDVFLANQYHENIIVQMKDKLKGKKYIIQGLSNKVPIIDISSIISRNLKINDLLKIQSSSILLGSKETLSKVERLLPYDFHRFHGEVHLPVLTRRRNYWKDQNKILKENKREKSWASELTWRIIRYYELRRTKKEAEYLKKQVEKLIPKWEGDSSGNEDIMLTDLTSGLVEPNKEFKGIDRDTSYTRHVRNMIEGIIRVGFPSVIECLIDGFDPHEDHKYDNTLLSGFKKMDLEKRHVMLEYQHRMHPEIAEFPRIHIYDEQALKTPEYMTNWREFPYSQYEKRVFWINVWGCMESNRNINQREVRAIVRELNKFVKWSRNNPKKENNKTEPWIVTILTFYWSQESAIREILEERYNKKFKHRFSPHKNIQVRLYTVDKYQGHETDVLFLSFVKANYGYTSKKKKYRRTLYAIGFLNSMNRLNVAITRPKYQLVLFGDRNYFTKQKASKLLQQLANEIEEGLPLAREHL